MSTASHSGSASSGSSHPWHREHEDGEYTEVEDTSGGHHDGREDDEADGDDYTRTQAEGASRSPSTSAAPSSGSTRPLDQQDVDGEYTEGEDAAGGHHDGEHDDEAEGNDYTRTQADV